MLRITVEENDDRTRFRLEGKLTGNWVTELERCWISVRSNTVKQFCVDLSSVSFVDETGKALLTRMVSQGAKLRARGPLMTSLAKEISTRTCGVETGEQRVEG
jgi:ABC-type transporter Mla MlaB component